MSCPSTRHIHRQSMSIPNKQVQSVHNFLPSDTTWKSEAHCRTVSTDAHVRCSAMSSLWWIHSAHNRIVCKFDCTITVLRDYFCSVNPPGCQNNCMPWLSHLFPEFYMKQYHYVGHTFSKSEQNQFLTNPPVAYIIQSQYTSYAPQYARKGYAFARPSPSLQSVEPTPATAHSGTYIHTNQSVEPTPATAHSGTHKPECGATAHSGTHKPECGADSSNSSLWHIYTHKPECGADSSNSSLWHIYTHKPECGADSSNSSLWHIHTQTRVWSRLQQQLTLAHIHTQTRVWSRLQQQLTLAHTHTNQSVEQLQQQLTLAHIHTQTLSVEDSSNSSLWHTQTRVWSSSSNSSLRYTQTHKHTYTHIQTTLHTY